jgi:hypothetical protein
MTGCTQSGRDWGLDGGTVESNRAVTQEEDDTAEFAGTERIAAVSDS